MLIYLGDNTLPRKLSRFLCLEVSYSLDGICKIHDNVSENSCVFIVQGVNPRISH